MCGYSKKNGIWQQANELFRKVDRDLLNNSEKKRLLQSFSYELTKRCLDHSLSSQSQETWFSKCLQELQGLNREVEQRIAALHTGD